jgi:hypothetical protein
MIASKPSFRSVLLALGAFSVSAVAQPEGLLWNEFTPRLTIDAGHIVQGMKVNQVDEEKFHPLNRSTVVLEQGATYRNWEFAAGFRSVVWWPYPGGNDPLRRNLRGMAQLSQLQAVYGFGDEGIPGFFRFGFFPYKYNPDARNLGEYLYRSGTYPGVVRNTDGYHLIDHALYEGYGLQARLSGFGGRLQHTFSLFAEQTTIPVGDLSPAYDFTFRQGVFELGGGAVLNRFITTQEKQLTPKTLENAFVRVDSAGARLYERPFGAAPHKNAIQTGNLPPDITYEVEYWTKRGVKLMARGAVDLGFLIPDFLIPQEFRDPGDLRVYAEAAVLGVEDQPYYYEDWKRRAPRASRRPRVRAPPPPRECSRSSPACAERCGWRSAAR